VDTPHRTQRQAPRQAWTAPAPPRRPPGTPPIGRSARPARLIPGTQDSPADPGPAVPSGITTPRTSIMPTTMADSRYQEMLRSPTQYFSGKPRTENPPKKKKPDTTSYKRGHKRNATEIVRDLGSPVRVESTSAKSLRLDKSRLSLNPTYLYPLSPDSSDEEKLDPDLSADAATVAWDSSFISKGEQSFIGAPARQHSDRAPLGNLISNTGYPSTRQGIHAQLDVERDDQRTNQPSDSFTCPPRRPEVSRDYWNRNQISDMRTTRTLPPNSAARTQSTVNLVERPISPSPGQIVLADPLQHSGTSRSVPDSPGQAGTRWTKNRRTDESCKRCNVRKIKVSSYRLVTFVQPKLIPQCTRTIPYLMCATCIDHDLECETGSIGHTESYDEKAVLPTLADTLAHTPSTDIPTGSLVDTGPDTQAIAAPSSESQVSHEQYGHNRRLEQALEVKDEMKPWIREEVPRTKRPWGDVGQGGDQF
jgi:ssDNA-binding Zn-finger/Zn-ribbon topoisomerase 1